MTCLDPNLSIHKASFGPWVGGGSESVQLDPIYLEVQGYRSHNTWIDKTQRSQFRFPSAKDERHGEKGAVARYSRRKGPPPDSRPQKRQMRIAHPQRGETGAFKQPMVAYVVWSMALSLGGGPREGRGGRLHCMRTRRPVQFPCLPVCLGFR